MDDLTAIAFAHEAFDKCHPVLPPDFRKYRGTSVRGPDSDGNFTVFFAWQRRTSTSGAESFFEVSVNGWNARTTVLLDTPLDDFRPEDFERYEA